MDQLDTSPPTYADAFPVPDYTADPTENEQRIEFRRRPREFSSLPTGIFVQKHEGVTIVLNNQEDGVSAPIYGRRSPVVGTLLFDDSESISEVTVQIKGRIEFLSISHGFSITDVCNDPCTLFKSSSGTVGDEVIVCPNALPFSSAFPPSVRYGERDFPIPPSHHMPLSNDAIGEYTKCSYQVVFTISRIRSRRVAFLGQSRRHLDVEIIYRPRSRPPRPIISDRSLFSTIKTCPEEWQQFTYVIFPKVDTNLDPLSCQLFLPSVGIYAIMDTIPFHIQVSGPRLTLSKLISNTSSAEGSDNPSSSSPPVSSILETLPIRMTLLRQVILEIDGRKTARQFSLGESKLVAIPPPPPSPPRSGSRGPGYQENLNWEGEVRCELEGGVCPSFNAGMVSVIDFVTLQIAKTNQSLYLPVRQGHPVRLVTDTWSDTADTYA
ncbi:hypothetical protein K435DRAFT_363384 [Dendrothele bispora CBS 962.96]|uniref:Arrestin-like N-terminal domain-containing protein n=1 Tax=Dendrothele bispora (strain CBS 962.96) TaxID=1314807 RepID=A0A4S8LCW3_DENBC|nr:hypothetical protein K435DRAFT_363384 [Dendrothele bispora CBS 962.96]